MKSFSVLMSVYQKDKPEYLKLSLQSIWDDQMLKPSEIIIVKDGPLGDELNCVIRDFSNHAPTIIIPLPVNMGLANALNEGLKYCHFNYIARMDADDISMPKRFERQISYLMSNTHIDMIGGAISEINENGEDRGKIIKYPTTSKECRSFFKKRNPVAHPSVVFSRNFFDKVGWKYPTSFERNEDTCLWLEGYKHGCVISNIQDVVLKYRITDNMFSNRRNGKVFAKSQLELRKIIKKELGFGFSALIYAYAMYYLMISPNCVLKIAYKLFR